MKLANSVEKWGYNKSIQEIFENDKDFHVEQDRSTFFDLLTKYREYKMNYAKNIKFDMDEEDLSK